MVLKIARRELLLQYREGRLLLACGIVLVLMLAAAISGWSQFAQAEARRAGFVDQAREQWLQQGERHPHRAAHFGVYVVKPELPLAFFEPGLRPFVGQTLWLEAHDRPVFSNIPSSDDLTLGVGLGVASGATILQMLGSLLVLASSALAVVRERESGVLRQVLAQGVSPLQWISGKFLGLFAAIVVPLLLLGFMAIAGLALFLPVFPGQQVDTLLRGSLLLGGNALLLVALLALGLLVSTQVRASRTALMIVLAFWLFSCVLGPRLASTLSTGLAPAPTLDAYRQAAGEAFEQGFDDRGGYGTQLAALESQVLAEYGVQTLDELPVGFSGLRMKHLDAWTAEVDDLEYRKLEQTYARQGGIRLALSTAAPFIAARSVSQGMAGMDWSHYRHFLQAAEIYRRSFGHQMNTLLEHGVTGDRWEMNGDFADWASVEPFQYELPGTGWAFEQQRGFILVLAGWVLASLSFLLLASRRLRP